MEHLAPEPSPPLGAESVRAARAELLARLVPEGVPRLWCPPLTHYDAQGGLDRARISAHLTFLSRWSKGLLVPGSTGDGWELTPEETREVIDSALAEAGRLGVRVLVGALHPDTEQALHTMSSIAKDPAAARAPSFCGFAVCPPRGAHLTQEELQEALTRLLSLGEPLALYQLPQITENEMSAELVARLAQRFYNAVLFKDSSGRDAVAGAGLDLAGLYLVRGAEGDYAKNLKANGGVYDGLLLSTANSLGAPLAEIVELSLAGRRDEAADLSARLSSLVKAIFDLVQGLPAGNAFANAGKAVDHFFAHGPQALKAAPPRLHAGSRLPVRVIERAGRALEQFGFMPKRGYLEL